MAGPEKKAYDSPVFGRNDEAAPVAEPFAGNGGGFDGATASESQEKTLQASDSPEAE